jgi:hypothetical protein
MSAVVSTASPVAVVAKAVLRLLEETLAATPVVEAEVEWAGLAEEVAMARAVKMRAVVVTLTLGKNLRGVAGIDMVGTARLVTFDACAVVLALTLTLLGYAELLAKTRNTSAVEEVAADWVGSVAGHSMCSAAQDVDWETDAVTVPATVARALAWVNGWYSAVVMVVVLVDWASAVEAHKAAAAAGSYRYLSMKRWSRALLAWQRSAGTVV